jgi:hypothetical protein
MLRSGIRIYTLDANKGSFPQSDQLEQANDRTKNRDHSQTTNERGMVPFGNYCKQQPETQTGPFHEEVWPHTTSDADYQENRQQNGQQNLLIFTVVILQGASLL